MEPFECESPLFRTREREGSYSTLLHMPARNSASAGMGDVVPFPVTAFSMKFTHHPPVAPLPPLSCVSMLKYMLHTPLGTLFR